MHRLIWFWNVRDNCWFKARRVPLHSTQSDSGASDVTSDVIPTSLFYPLAITLFMGVLAAATSLGIIPLEAAHPPRGRFIEIQGVRLHIAEIGLRQESPGADPAVVLIHGASGNLEDMRLALGEKLALSHRVILVDRPGHGWSSRPEGDDFASLARRS